MNNDTRVLIWWKKIKKILLWEKYMLKKGKNETMRSRKMRYILKSK